MNETFRQGNYKDAYEGFRKLAFDPENNSRQVGDDLSTAVLCLENLDRADEIDALLEDVVKVHKDDWWLLWHAAQNSHEHPASRLHRGGQVLSRQPSRRRPNGQLRRARPHPRPAMDGPGDAAGPEGRGPRRGGRLSPGPGEHAVERPRLERFLAVAVPQRPEGPARLRGRLDVLSPDRRRAGRRRRQPGLSPRAQEFRLRRDRRPALAVVSRASGRVQPAKYATTCGCSSPSSS